MTKLYPSLPRLRQPRVLKLTDFPEQRMAGWTTEAHEYWKQHHIVPPVMPTCYPTNRGICYILFGGLGYQERIFTGRRFYYPYGVDVAPMLYVPIDYTLYIPRPELIIVEGTTDALAVHQSGYDSVSLLGTALTYGRMELLHVLARGHQRLYFIPDSDEPGLSVLDYLLQGGLPVKVRYLSPGVKDMCDLSIRERKIFLDNAVQ